MGSTDAAIGIFEGYQIPKSSTVVYAVITGTTINREATVDNILRRKLP